MKPSELRFANFIIDNLSVNLKQEIMNNQNNPQDNVHQGKSAEAQLATIKNIIAVDNGYSDWNQFLRVDPDCALENIDTVSMVFSECRSIAPQSRIAELEAQNKKLKEALELIISYEDRGRLNGEPRISDHWYNICKQALKEDKQDG